ncbi:GAF domain-containing SpoIIE family protein phosphatase [Rubritalea sp.]|uniref:GAF domain-containing SpoIIE family protein phosphatase n=1 Tax=Rubritalea sp. TaxID=2109375 RepID=UPI003EF4E6EA
MSTILTQASYVDEIENALALSLCFSTLLLFLLLLKWRKTKALLDITERMKKTLEGEGNRLFEFLHMLGIALEEDHSATTLHREIVDGVNDVVSSRGGALYLLSSSGRYLIPKHITEKCPLLIGLPMEVFKKSGGDMGLLKSHIQLSKVPSAEGMLGAVLSSGVPQKVDDVKYHEAFKDTLIHYAGDVTAMLAPLSYGGRDLGVLAVARPLSEGQFTQSEFTLFRSASEQAAFALGNATIHQEAGEKRKIEGELRTAQQVQQVLLPKGKPEVLGYEIEGLNKPARLISGDYYDYINLGEGKWGVAIADVSGKGVAAGLLMAMCRSVLRAELRRGADPLHAVSQVNRLMFNDIKEDSFVSLALYIINEENGHVQLVRAGHDKAPIYRKATDSIEWVKPPGLAIGLDDGDVFDRITKLHEFQLDEGDTLLLYTDGVTEAYNSDEEEFGLERMVDVLRESSDEGVDVILVNLMKSINGFVSGALQSDDITLIAVQKK